MEHFLAKSDVIDIYCWDEEIDTIEEIQSQFIGKIKIRKEEKLTIMTASNSSLLTEYLLKSHLNNRGELKWFTVNLYKDLASMFYASHWGTEFVVPHVTEKDIAFIVSVTPEETIFHHYQN
ncbi:hypothetical protein [Sporosarcina sp. A2]|uniref:hypothetical protein n=1 Tax=Sporosarcina sp. A2 TaxID=3393449 RepID=UPI003D7B56CF